MQSTCSFITFLCWAISGVISPLRRNRIASSTLDHLSTLVTLIFASVETKQRTPAWKASKVRSLNTFKIKDGIPEANSVHCIHNALPEAKDTIGAQNSWIETFEHSFSEVNWSATMKAENLSSERVWTSNEDFCVGLSFGGGVGSSLILNPSNTEGGCAGRSFPWSHSQDW